MMVHLNKSVSLHSTSHLPDEIMASESHVGPLHVNAIILVHWQIRPTCEIEFLNHWRTVSLVANRTGLVGEFLSEVVSADPISAPFITWILSEPGSDIAKEAKHFVNVGMWSSEIAFLTEIAADFEDNAPLRPFELRRRRRLMLNPTSWRIGAAQLPSWDSAGVR